MAKARGPAPKGTESKALDVIPPPKHLSSGRERSLANLRPWPKGVSGNPGGYRPDPIRPILSKILEEKDPKAKVTRLEAFLRDMLRLARKGHPEPIRFLDRRIPNELILERLAPSLEAQQINLAVIIQAIHEAPKDEDG